VRPSSYADKRSEGMMQGGDHEGRTVDVSFRTEGWIAGQDGIYVRVYSAAVGVEGGVFAKPFLSGRQVHARGD
jgi:hypothetical protein